MNNTAGKSGGGIILWDSTVHLRAWNKSQHTPITIQDNHATANGGFMAAYDSIISIEQYHVKNNSAQYGGVFLIWNTSLTLVGSNDHVDLTVFEDNIAVISGGVIYDTDNSLYENIASLVVGWCHQIPFRCSH
jgi:hypothetical protein